MPCGMLSRVVLCQRAFVKIRVVNSLSDTAHAKSVSLIIVVRIHAATVEVHTVRVVRVVLHGRPIVALRTGVVQRTGCVVVTVPDSGKLRIEQNDVSRRLQKAVQDPARSRHIGNRIASPFFRLRECFFAPSSLLNLRGTLGQLSCTACRPTLAATLIVFKVVNSRRTQRTLNPFRLSLLFVFTLPLLKFMSYALVELFCVDDQ